MVISTVSGWIFIPIIWNDVSPSQSFTASAVPVCSLVLRNALKVVTGEQERDEDYANNNYLDCFFLRFLTGIGKSQFFQSHEAKYHCTGEQDRKKVGEKQEKCPPCIQPHARYRARYPQHTKEEQERWR